MAKYYHADFPTILLVNGDKIRDRENQVKSAKERTPGDRSKDAINGDTRKQDEDLLDQGAFLQTSHV